MKIEEKIEKYLNEEFPNHAGRPGRVGGSSPKDGSSKHGPERVREFTADIKTVAGTLSTSHGKYHPDLLDKAIEDLTADPKNYDMTYDQLKKHLIKFRFAEHGSRLEKDTRNKRQASKR